MTEKKDDRKIVSLSVAHMPHVSVDTGLRHLTIEHARVEVSVTLDDDTVHTFAVIRTPRRGVRKATKVEMARKGFEPIVGMRWADVQRVALHFQFLPLGVPWGISPSKHSRWFTCFCGGNTHVSKEIWKKYSEGEQVTITCNHCTLSQDLKKA